MLLRSAGLLVGTVAVTLLLAEGVVRFLEPTPRAQLMRREHVKTFGVMQDTPVWQTRRPELEPRCTDPDVLRISFVGSSILWGSGIQGPEVFSLKLQEQLTADLGRAVCVENLAQPAFAGGQKAVMALDALSQRPPDILVWESWEIDPATYAMLNDNVAMMVSKYELDDAGIPLAFPFMRPVNAWLFQSSALYAYATVALGPYREDRNRNVALIWDEMVLRDLVAVVDAAERAETQVVFALFPPLHQPLSTSAHSLYPGYGSVELFAERRGASVIYVAEETAHLDHLEMRADPCCHWSAKGHEALSEMFARELAPLLSSR